jgi:hypothetical protein
VNATGSATVQRKTADTFAVTPSAVSTSCVGTRSSRSRRSTSWCSARRRTTCRPGPSTTVASPSRRSRRTSHGWTVREGRKRSLRDVGSSDMGGPPSRRAVGGWDGCGWDWSTRGWWPATTAAGGDRTRRADRIRLRARRREPSPATTRERSESRTHRSEQLRYQCLGRAVRRGTTRGTRPGTPAPPLISPWTSVGAGWGRPHLVFVALWIAGGTLSDPSAMMSR